MSQITLHQYLLDNLKNTVMITLDYNGYSHQYDKWNWFHTTGEFHLIKDDGSIGHILHGGYITDSDQGVLYNSNFYPKQVNLNFYFGGNINGNQ